MVHQSDMTQSFFKYAHMYLFYLIFQLFHLKESGLSNESLRQQFRDICISAAVDGQPTVLVISSSIDIRRQEWEDVYKLMNEGAAKKKKQLTNWWNMMT